MKRVLIMLVLLFCSLVGCKTKEIDIEENEDSILNYNRITDNEEEMTKLLFLNSYQGAGYVCDDPKRVPTYSEDLINNKDYIYEMELLNSNNYYCLYVNKHYEGSWESRLFEDMFALEEKIVGNYTVDAYNIMYIKEPVVNISDLENELENFEWIKISRDNRIPKKIGTYYAIAVFEGINVKIKNEIKGNIKIDKEMIFFEPRKFIAKKASSLLTEVATTLDLNQDLLISTKTTPERMTVGEVLNNIYLGFSSLKRINYKVFEEDNQKFVLANINIEQNLGVFKNLFEEYYVKKGLDEFGRYRYDIYQYEGFLEVSKNISDEIKLENLNNSLWVDEANQMWLHMNIDKLTNFDGTYCVFEYDLFSLLEDEYTCFKYDGYENSVTISNIENTASKFIGNIEANYEEIKVNITSKKNIEKDIETLVLKKIMITNFNEEYETPDIVIPDDKTKIDARSYYNCSDISSITLSNNINEIGEYAFGRITADIEFDSGDTLKTIDALAFAEYLGENIVLQNSIESISEYAFYKCLNLKSIVIPSSVLNIDKYVFKGCENLTIYCEAESKPEGWSDDWNPDNRPVVWRYTGE